MRTAAARIDWTCCVVGVGGHGGSGIHADIDDKYREIVTRVSNYSPLRQPRPVVPVSPRQKAVPAAAPAKTPAAVRPPSSQVDRGPRTSVRTSDDRGDPGSGGGDGDRGGDNQSSAAAGGAAAQRTGSGQVQPVHVTKCTVCTIL